jgi:hypothetical protein
VERCDDSNTPMAFHEGSDSSLCRIGALPTDAATVQEPAYTVKTGALTLALPQASQAHGGAQLQQVHWSCLYYRATQYR